MKSPGSLEWELVELERYGRKDKPGAQSSVRVQNITNRFCVLLQCTMIHSTALQKIIDWMTAIYPQEKIRSKRLLTNQSITAGKRGGCVCLPGLEGKFHAEARSS